MGTTRHLITGGSGQLARELSKRLPGSVARSREEFSIVDRELVRREISRSRPEIVFNSAAYNGVDRAYWEIRSVDLS
jgi:dTDP-4-dehydrorhamnose reductase